jgi:hypothetical protein
MLPQAKKRLCAAPRKSCYSELSKRTTDKNGKYLAAAGETAFEGGTA